MKANEFVKKFGWERARKIVNEAGYKHCTFNLNLNAWQQFPSPDCDHVVINDLKRLVESWELVESIGGLAFAKNFLDKTGSTMGGMLEQAIQLVESVNA